MRVGELQPTTIKQGVYWNSATSQGNDLGRPIEECACGDAPWRFAYVSFFFPSRYGAEP